MKHEFNDLSTPCCAAEDLALELSRVFNEAGLSTVQHGAEDGVLRLTVKDKTSGQSLSLDIISQEAVLKDDSFGSYQTGEVVLAKLPEVSKEVYTVRNLPKMESLSMSYQGAPADNTWQFARRVIGQFTA